jgi:hypothetical protein
MHCTCAHAEGKEGKSSELTTQMQYFAPISTPRASYFYCAAIGNLENSAFEIVDE